MPGARSHANKKFVRWRLICVGLRYGTWLHAPILISWTFETATRFLENVCTPAFRYERTSVFIMDKAEAQ